MPKPAAPKPARPPTSKPNTPVASAAAKGIFLVCRSDGNAGPRYYNSPVEVTSGGYDTWQPSYQKFLKQNYRYDRGVGCSKLPTLADAQADFKTALDNARVSTKINGIPSPVIITNWKYP
jgi:hypothetical protein